MKREGRRVLARRLHRIHDDAIGKAPGARKLGSRVILQSDIIMYAMGNLVNCKLNENCAMLGDHALLLQLKNRRVSALWPHSIFDFSTCICVSLFDSASCDVAVTVFCRRLFVTLRRPSTFKAICASTSVANLASGDSASQEKASVDSRVTPAGAQVTLACKAPCFSRSAPRPRGTGPQQELTPSPETSRLTSLFRTPRGLLLTRHSMAYGPVWLRFFEPQWPDLPAQDHSFVPAWLGLLRPPPHR